MWVDVADKNGYNRYPRPVVILTPNAEIEDNDILYGVVGSRTAAMRIPLADSHIQLPYHTSGHVVTKLRSPTAVVCDWIVPVEKARIQEGNLAGVVPPRLLCSIISKCAKLNG